MLILQKLIYNFIEILIKNIPMILFCGGGERRGEGNWQNIFKIDLDE